jgi:small subunit ribosomal protein S1
MTDNMSQNSDDQPQTALQEQLQEEYLKTIGDIEVGQLLEGTVIEVGSEQVYIDVGYKSEGKVPIDEFDETPDIGDTVEVVLLNKETKSGEVVVSKRKADEARFWKEVKEAHQNREPVEGVIKKSIKGGFEVSLGHNVRAFNPMSKMDLHRIEDPEEYVNLRTKFYVERLYSDGRVNIVLSRRDWLEEQVDRRKKQFFEEVRIGDIVEGTVKSFTSFGAFIDLGGFDGLLHINDMSWGHVTRPKDYVDKGQEIQLKVIRLDPEAQKINLSLRHMTPDPWESFEQKYGIDQEVSGTVTKLTDFGAFIELEEGIEGLAHISELSWTKRINHPKEVVSPGQEVRVKILAYDLQEGKVSLGLKQATPNPWDEIEHKFPEGLRVTAPVKKITNTGAFVELEEGIDGFLHVDDISWTKRYKHPGAALEEGQEIECMVIQSDARNHNVRVGIKQLAEDPWESLKKAYPEGTIIEGEVTNITDFGVFLRVQGGIEGLIAKPNITDPRKESYEEAMSRIKVGDTLRAVITEINTARQRLSLSVRELEKKEQAQELEKYIHDERDESTFTLGEMLEGGDQG